MNANVLIAKKGPIPFFSERKSVREHYKLNFTQTYIAIIVIIAFMSVYYAYTMNTNATKGYTIRTLQIKNRELAFQENLLDIRIAEGQSIGTITNSTIAKEMINVDQAGFLMIKGQTRSIKD